MYSYKDRRDDKLRERAAVAPHGRAAHLHDDARRPQRVRLRRGLTHRAVVARTPACAPARHLGLDARVGRERVV